MPLPSEVAVRVKRLPHGEGLELPGYATDGAAGMDVLSAEALTLAPGARHAVATGLALAIPAGFEVQVRPRSGLALKHGITVPNTPGTIDSDYRGELKVILINHGSEPFEVRRGDRLVLERVSVAIEPGRITAIVGPNGAGKSTLLRLMTGLIAPTAGAISIDGVGLAGLGRQEIARRIAVVPSWAACRSRPGSRRSLGSGDCRTKTRSAACGRRTGPQ